MSEPRLKSVEFKKLPIDGFKTLATNYEILKDQETGVLYYYVRGGASL